MNKETINKQKKRTLFNEKSYKIDYNTQTIIINPKLKDYLIKNNRLRKITGTKLPNLILNTPFSSKLEVFMSIFGLNKPIKTFKYIESGNYFEPKIISYLEKKLKTKIKTLNPQEINFDYFQDIKIFGGIPDGIINNEKQKILFEIKTTNIKNKPYIEKNAKIEHFYQSALYSYLLKIPTIKIVYLFLEEKDYINPSKKIINETNIKIHTYTLNFEKFKNEKLISIKKWFEKYTKSGISPTFSLPKDQEFLKFLECKTKEEHIKYLKEL